MKSKEEIKTKKGLQEETEELLEFGSWAWHINSNTVTWTSGLYILLGYEPEEVANKINYDFYFSHVSEEYLQPFLEVIQHALRNKTDFDYEYIVKTNSGQLKTISTRGKSIIDDAGNVEKLLCINRDVTALRSFEKDQERNIRDLNRSNKELQEFAYIASHDLQEPLRKISMFTERLKAKYQNTLDKEGELYMERIQVAAGNMRTLIDTLLEFSRANRRANPYGMVNLGTIFDEVISDPELKIEETKSIIKISGNFPLIEAVSSEMVQLFSNLLSNSIKFRKHMVPAEIDISSVKISKAESQLYRLPANNIYHKIEIRDKGIGFEPEYKERVFQIFQRLNGKSEYPGSGIGLAICKKIVKKHNGVIFAESEPDQGAVFTVILPEKQL